MNPCNIRWLWPTQNLAASPILLSQNIEFVINQAKMADFFLTTASADYFK